mmetsp:Transcript_8866/g.29002  ORF Transcript_8866/g.29002 Transcript_8866/m.29002 type:complete len:370 (+) Transcript_8866:60-1169(+)
MSKRLSLLPNFFISLSSSSSVNHRRETTTKKNLNHHRGVVTTTNAKTTFAFESSVAASDDVMKEENVVHVRRKRKDDENDDFSPLFELALRCFQTEFPNLVVQQHIRGGKEGETQKSRCSWETKSEKIGRERVEVTTRTVVLRPKPGANEEELMERIRITFVSGGTIAHCLNVHCTPRRAFTPSFGADVLNFGNGKNVLVGIDFHPNSIDTSDDRSSNTRKSRRSSSNSLAKRIAREIKDKYGEKLNATTPSEKFYEDTSGYFSEEMFFARPSFTSEKGKEENFQLVLECFEAYLRGYVEILKEERGAEVEEEETTEVKEAFRRRLAEHDKWQIERDPAIKMFSKWYGEEWANAYASEVLFPLAKECDE